MLPQAVLQTLDRLWRCVEPLGLPIALMGGIAMSVWKHIRATRDVDILIAVASEEEPRLLSTLTNNGFHPLVNPAIRSFGEFRLLQVTFDPPDAFVTVRADLLIVLNEYHRQALDHRVPVRLPNLEFPIFVLSCEDLILHKLAAGRLIDRADCVALIQLNRSNLDISYLAHWVRSLNQQTLLIDIWREAFPEELPPSEIST
jgi:hypothetical protein